MTLTFRGRVGKPQECPTRGQVLSLVFWYGHDDADCMVQSVNPRSQISYNLTQGEGPAVSMPYVTDHAAGAP